MKTPNGILVALTKVQSPYKYGEKGTHLKSEGLSSGHDSGIYWYNFG